MSGCTLFKERSKKSNLLPKKTGQRVYDLRFPEGDARARRPAGKSWGASRLLWLSKEADL